MKKIIIILISGIAIVIMASVIYSLFFSNKSEKTINSPSSNTVSSSSAPLPKASDVFKNLPTGTTLAIGTPHGTVNVSNFYLNNPSVDDGGDLVIKQTENYVVVYDPTDGSFWLGITGTPFAMWQQTAEQSLLKTLGISDADACKLKVTSGVIYKAGDPNDGKSFPLSFCSGAGVIQ